MPTTKSTPKKRSVKSSARKTTVLEDVMNASLIGSESMATMEPFGSAIGAVMGGAEEGLAILRGKKRKPKPKAKR